MYAVDVAGKPLHCPQTQIHTLVVIRGLFWGFSPILCTASTNHWSSLLGTWQSPKALSLNDRQAGREIGTKFELK